MTDLRVLEEQKNLLEQTLPDLLARAQTEDERTTLRRLYTAACEQWNDAINASLQANDDRVCECLDQIAAAQRCIQDSIRRQEQVATIIGHIATGVGAGTKLLTVLPIGGP